MLGCLGFLQNKERGHNNVTKEELESCMINQVTFVLYHTYTRTTDLGLEGKIGRKRLVLLRVKWNLGSVNSGDGEIQTAPNK